MRKKSQNFQMKIYRFKMQCTMQSEEKKIAFDNLQIVPSAIFTFASRDYNKALNSNFTIFFWMLQCAM